MSAPTLTAPTLTELRVRPACPHDEPTLAALFLAARPALAFTGLDGPGLRQLLELQRRAQRAAFDAAWPGHRTDLLCRGDAVVAMIATARAADTVHVLDLAVDESARGQGVGTAALTWVIAMGYDVELTVADGNPARRLYERLGFAEAGRCETDVLMRRPATARRSR